MTFRSHWALAVGALRSRDLAFVALEGPGALSGRQDQEAHMPLWGFENPLVGRSLFPGPSVIPQGFLEAFRVKTVNGGFW